jgi:pyruvate kinase
MYRGVHPILFDVKMEETSRFATAVKQARTLGFCQSKDNVIIVSESKGCPEISKAITMRLVTVE